MNQGKNKNIIYKKETIGVDNIIAIVIMLAILIIISAVVTFAKNGLAMMMMNIINKILGNKK